MCRVIIRPQTRVLGGLLPAEASTDLGDLLTDMTSSDFTEPKTEPLDESSGLMCSAEEFNLQESDADLLAMFHELSDEAPTQAPTPMATLPVPQFEQVARPACPVLPQAQPMNLFEQQMMFQQAMLAQQVQQQQQQQQLGLAQMVAKPACYPGMRRGKTPEEIAAQIERTKQRRRESAHRSRSRRKDYMKQLEDENDTLKAEIAALRAQLKARGVTPVSASSQAGSGASAPEQHDSGSSAIVAETISA